MLFLFVSLWLSLSEAKYDLPTGAKIIEARALVSTAHPHRALVLWMINPEKNARDPQDGYTCPEETRGHNYYGATRVSLVDLKTKKIINTIDVKSDNDEPGHDHFAVPYKIARYYYGVVSSKAKESKPIILSLQDFNRDGKAHEFVLYDKVNCMTVLTALFGYSERQDKIIQYQTVLQSTEDGKPHTETVGWVDRLFYQRPNKNGVWHYQIDYRGRGGARDQYTVHYNARLERFEGTFTFTE